MRGDRTTAKERLPGPRRCSVQGGCCRRRVGTWLARRLLMAVLILSAVVAQAADPPAVDRGNDIMAVVNGSVITRRAFQVVYRQAVDRHAREGRPVDEANLSALRRAVIERMVDEELLFQESRRQGIAVPEAAVEAALAAARDRFNGADGLARELARRQMDPSQFRRMQHRQIAIERLLAREVAPNVTVAEDELRRFYDAHQPRFRAPEAVHLRHILVRRGEAGASGGEAAARQTIEGLKAQLEQGGDFAALARRYSEEPAAAQGGDLGYVQRGQLLPSLESAAFDLAPGAISPVLVSEVGFHLFTVIDRRPAAQIPFEAARSDIRQTLWEEKYDRALRSYLQTLRERADIQAAR